MGYLLWHEHKVLRQPTSSIHENHKYLHPISTPIYQDTVATVPTEKNPPFNATTTSSRSDPATWAAQFPGGKGYTRKPQVYLYEVLLAFRPVLCTVPYPPMRNHQYIPTNSKKSTRYITYGTVPTKPTSPTFPVPGTAAQSPHAPLGKSPLIHPPTKLPCK